MTDVTIAGVPMGASASGASSSAVSTVDLMAPAREENPMLTSDAARATAGYLTQIRNPLAPDANYTDTTSSFTDTAKSMFMLNTVVGEVLDTLATYKDYNKSHRSSYFNPYAYFQDNLDKFGDFPELTYFVKRGDLDSSRSMEEFDARAGAIKRELDRRQTIANGGTLGLIGGTALSFLDVTTLIPVLGWAGKAGIVAKAGIMAANAAAVVGSQEWLLHQMQSTRTKQESFEAIGIGTLLGAGLGAFHGIISPKHVLNPRNAANPLRLSNGVPVESTVGAAANRQPVRYAEGTGLGPIDKIGYWLKSPTSVARAVSEVDAESARLLEDISRTGVTTRANEAGVADLKESAEDILEAEYMPKLLATQEKLYDNYKAALADLDAGKFAVGKMMAENVPGLNKVVPSNPVSQAEWDRHVFLMRQDPKYTTGNPTLDKWVRKTADDIGVFFNWFHQRGVEMGALDPNQKIDNYFVHKWVSHKIAENPNSFEAFLLEEFLRKPDNDWLQETYGITPEQFDGLPLDRSTAKPTEDGSTPLTRRQVLQQWAADTEADALRKAELDAEAKADEAKRAHEDFRQRFREARKLNSPTTRLEVRELKAIVQEQEASRAVMQQRLEALRLQEKELIEAATAARTRTLARQRQLFPIREDAGAAELDKLNQAMGDTADAGARLNKFLEGGEPNPDWISQHNELTTRLDEAKARSDDALMGATEVPIEAPAAPREIATPSQARANARAKAITEERQHVEAQLRRMEDRLDAMQSRLMDIATKTEAAKAARKAALQLAKDAKARDLEASKASKKANSKAKAAAKRKTASQAAEEIKHLLMDRSKVPNGMLTFSRGSLDPVAKSGRLKERGIKLSPEALRTAVDNGWLSTNLNEILHGYTLEVGGRLSMLEKFGSVDLEDQVKALRERFATLKSNAGSAEARKKLTDMETVAVQTMETLRNRVLGIDGIPDDPESFLMYMGRVMRLTNFLRWMGGTMLSSVTDLATSAFTNRSLLRTLTPLTSSVRRFAKDMNDREVQALLFGAENVLMYSRASKTLGVDDLQYIRGFGTGTTRTVSASVEGGLRALSEKMSVLNGMSWWNSRLRFQAGMIQLQNILADAKALKAGKALDDSRVTEYARFGMEQSDLIRVADLIEKHGEVNEYGLIDPNSGAWDGAAGAEARRRLLVLLKRATQEAVIAPTFGDLPPFMTKPAGRMLAQFQSFGFAAVNKYVRNLRYAAVDGRGWDALMSVTLALAMGATAYAVKDGVVKNQPLSDKPGTWVYEAVDRSGLSMYLMPLMNAGFKLGTPAMNSMGIDWFDLPSRYRQQSWLTALLGPSFGFLEDTSGLGSSLASGDIAKAKEKALRMLPFQNLFYLEAIWRRANGEQQ